MRVVVAEAARSGKGKGTLRRILEAEGFEILGRASGPDELGRLLGATDPQVVVFDAETSAMTVLSARDWAPGVGVVVVWPSSVIATAADQQVEPSRAASDLGDAVRAAVRVRREPVAPPAEEPVEVAAVEPAPSEGEIGTVEPVGVPGSRRGELFMALAGVTLFLLAVVAALALRSTPRPGFLALPAVPGPAVTGPEAPQEPSQPTLGHAGILDSLRGESGQLAGAGSTGGSSGGSAPDLGGGPNPGNEPPDGGSPGDRPSDEPRGKDHDDHGHHGDGNSGGHGHHGDGNSGGHGHHGDGNSGGHGHHPS